MNRYEQQVAKLYVLLRRDEKLSEDLKTSDQILDFIHSNNLTKEQKDRLAYIGALQCMAESRGLDLEILATDLEDWRPTKEEERETRSFRRSKAFLGSWADN
jgi:hypothetical protein